MKIHKTNSRFTEKLAILLRNIFPQRTLQTVKVKNVKPDPFKNPNR